MNDRDSRRGEVVLVSRSADRDGHEYRTQASLARRIADLIGFEFAREADAPARVPRYVVPDQTLATFEASALGIRAESDLFGGFVPHRFMATKVITHPLVADDAARPHGWPATLGEALRGITLRGYAAFSVRDVRTAIARLARDAGPIRVKLAEACGGTGQFLVQDAAAADALAPRLDEAELAACGVVVEEDLRDATTYSVGWVNLRGAAIAYCGIQRTVVNRAGERVYGGSDLLVVRGGIDRLLARALERDLATAIRSAVEYDRLVTHATGVCASRRNYDVLRGEDARGHERIGVLEQSWRLGGGSGAEIAALEAFARDPRMTAIRASTFESYADDPPPAGATVYFHDREATRGPTSKYSVVEPFDDPGPMRGALREARIEPVRDRFSIDKVGPR